MSAIRSSKPDSDAERIARHLRMCREITDLGMTLAHIAATRALAVAEGAESESKDVGRSRNTPDSGQDFLRLSTVVMQTIEMELRLAASQSQKHGQPASVLPKPNPREVWNWPDTCPPAALS